MTRHKSHLELLVTLKENQYVGKSFGTVGSSVAWWKDGEIAALEYRNYSIWWWTSRTARLPSIQIFDTSQDGRSMRIR